MIENNLTVPVAKAEEEIDPKGLEVLKRQYYDALEGGKASFEEFKKLQNRNPDSEGYEDDYKKITAEGMAYLNLQNDLQEKLEKLSVSKEDLKEQSEGVKLTREAEFASENAELVEKAKNEYLTLNQEEADSFKEFSDATKDVSAPDYKEKLEAIQIKMNERAEKKREAASILKRAGVNTSSL